MTGITASPALGAAAALTQDQLLVPLSILDSEQTTIQTLVDRVRLAHYRLVWVAGGSSAMRSAFLRQFAKKVASPILNVGKLVSSCLLDQPASLRSSAAEGVFYYILHTSDSSVVCLDNLEILFDQALMLKAVDLVRNSSRRFVLIASWPGTADSSSLTFGPADHPSYFRIPLSELECPVHTLSLS